MLGGWEENPAVGFMNTLEESNVQGPKPKGLCSNDQRLLAAVIRCSELLSLLESSWRTLDLGHWTLDTTNLSSDY